MTFSEEKIVFNTGCIFKIEFEIGQEYRLYFDFQLVQSTFTKCLNDGIPETARKINVADQRRIYINSYSSLNCFKRVLFDDSDFFSLTDVYLIAQPMGEKVRIHPYQLSEFTGFSLETRRAMHHEAFQQEMELGISKNSQLMLAFPLSPQEFYGKMIGEKLMRYRKLCQTLQRFQYYTSSLTTGGERGAVDLLEWIRA